MRAITKGWPPKRRKEQATRIKRQKPWLKSTGPRSKAGKARISHNAYKHGFRSRDYDEICRLLRWQKAFMKQILVCHCEDNRGIVNKTHQKPFDFGLHPPLRMTYKETYDPAKTHNCPV